MNNIYKILLTVLIAFVALSCTDDYKEGTLSSFNIESAEVDGQVSDKIFNRIDVRSTIKLVFSEPVDESTIEKNIYLRDKDKAKVKIDYTFDGDRTLTITPKEKLKNFALYEVVVQTFVKSTSNQGLYTGKVYNLNTYINPDDKFPRISQDALLDLVQSQTFKYFWDNAEPNSGMARERNSSGDKVTTGGTGFGVMAMLVASERGFITRDEALARIQKIVTFLDTKADKFQGAYSHWINGSTGKTESFGNLAGGYTDNGADLVETALLFQGLLSAKSYFNSGGAEATLVADITRLYEAVEWNKFVKPGSGPCNNTSVLFWHWNPTQGFSQLEITGWNESLIVYVLAAGSPTYPIAIDVYDTGWAACGAMRNGEAFYGIDLPLGPAYGGPLFLSQYSFLGLNPKGMSDQWAPDYWLQNVNHTLINRAYCVDNPNGKAGYSEDIWGLTASDTPGGYTAHSPENDRGTISPTAAISALPYTPMESMQTLEFYYYKLGDLIWGDYGFKDAFNFGENWVADGYIAIDQGPQIIMIENHRTGLLWNTFMALPEVQTGLDNLGFTYSVTTK